MMLKEIGNRLSKRKSSMPVPNSSELGSRASGPTPPAKKGIHLHLPWLLAAPILAIAGLFAVILMPGKDNRRWIQSLKRHLS